MDRKYLVAYLITSGVILILWASNLFIPYFLTLLPFVNLDPSEFGSMFGSANALFTGLAFAGFLVTMWMQSEEIKLQRMDLRIAIEEQKKTRLEMRKQSIALDQQVEINKKNLQFIVETYIEQKKPFITLHAYNDRFANGYSYIIVKTMNHGFRIIETQISNSFEDKIKIEFGGVLHDYLKRSHWIINTDKEELHKTGNVNNYGELRIVVKDQSIISDEGISFDIKILIQDENGIIYKSTIQLKNNEKFYFSGSNIKLNESMLLNDFLILERVT